jgi:hypothetical protein
MDGADKDKDNDRLRRRPELRRSSLLLDDDEEDLEKVLDCTFKPIRQKAKREREGRRGEGGGRRGA